nr:VOC family protein [Rhodococcus sp. MH15]
MHSSIVVYTEDTDEFVARAVTEGGTLVTAVADTFSGDRHGVFLDPFGHRWAVCTKVEDVPAEEVARRAWALFFPETQSPQ